jgi:hypothetical protein
MLKTCSLAAVALGLTTLGSAQFLGPSSYVEFSDSPFSTTGFVDFHLEDFEDGSLNSAGVSASGGSVLGPSSLTDSVDEDDGSVDGSGTAGHSWYSSGARKLRFTFDKSVLGYLPTHAGIVWTDVGFTDSLFCIGDVEFEAFDENGASLGMLLEQGLGDGAADGKTAEDRFFGIVHLGGISAIEIRMPESGDWEVDHLQYGVVPEPATIAVLGLGLAAAFRRRKKA